jgi:ComF family protein
VPGKQPDPVGARPPGPLVRLWRECADLLAPPRCDVCGALGADALCDACAEVFDKIEPPYCKRCGRWFDPAAKGGPLCVECRESPPAFELARAFGRHTESLRQAVLNYKFAGARRLAKPLADRLVGVLEAVVARGELAEDAVEALVPVPLHEKRRKWRGFDQAERLAREMGALTGVRLLARALVRQRDTAPQVELTAEQRAQNVRGAFAVVKPWLVRGRELLLVDDVFTTGATMNECARALRDAGATAVYAVTVTRSSPDWDAGRDLY